MSRIKTLLFVLALAAQVPLASAKVTYQVGGCLPKLTSFTTISAAVAATPAPDVVEVCPGTYPEQVVITTPMTLEGISSGNSSQPIIEPPASGLAVNATSLIGVPVAAQVLVESGPVNITNITVDGTNNNVNGAGYLAGIFYPSSSFGTVNEVTARNQIDQSEGVGIWAENGTSTMETVTIENSDIHDVDGFGIFTACYYTQPTLTATVKGNTVAGGPVGPIVAILNNGATGSIANNVASDFAYIGIDDIGSSVTISGNTTTASEANVIALGIYLNGSDEVVKSNLVLNNSGSSDTAGIYLLTGSATVQSNKIAHNSIAIEFNCETGNTVSGNTITDAATGIDNVPSVAVTNTYYGVETVRTDCSDSASAAKPKPPSLLKKLMP